MLSVTNNMQELLEKEYQKISKDDLSLTGKVNLLNNIIQLKLNEDSLRNYYQDLSVDIKRYLNSLVALIEGAPRNYDIIDTEKLSFLGSVPYKHRIIYIDYLIRILEKSAFKNEIRNLQRFRCKIILKYSSEHLWRLTSIPSILIYFPLYNIYSLITSLVLITLVANLILMPACYSWMSWLNFELNYQNLSDHIVLNHFLNITAGLLSLPVDFSIKPQNEISTIIMIFGKIFIFSYVATLIFNKLTDLIKR
jgi:hypothetical protein